MLIAAIVAFSGSVLLHRADGTSAPVPAVLVELSRTDDDPSPITAVTAIDGRFFIPQVESGDYYVSLRSTKLEYRAFLYVAGNDDRTLYLFEPACWAMYGRVSEAGTHTPIVGATVYYLGRATTDANGDYFIDWSCASGPGFRFHNTFFYTIRAAGYVTIDRMGGRAEYVSGPVQADWELRPLYPGYILRPDDAGRDH